MKFLTQTKHFQQLCQVFSGKENATSHLSFCSPDQAVELCFQSGPVLSALSAASHLPLPELLSETVGSAARYAALWASLHHPVMSPAVAPPPLKMLSQKKTKQIALLLVELILPYPPINTIQELQMPLIM